MATKKLDITVTKEAIERNFILLNTIFTSYDKQITALQSGTTETGLSDGAKEEIAALVAKYKTELIAYVKKVVADVSFNLNDYYCFYTNITANEYINFKIVDSLEAEIARLYYNAVTGTWQVAYNGVNAFDVGNMSKSVYDANSDGKVDVAETAEAVTYIDLAIPPTDGQILTFNANTSKFQPGIMDRSADGGSAVSVYLAIQSINGGAAGG